MKKLYYIFNIRSGKSAIVPKLASTINMFNKAGYEVTVHSTQKRMDACYAAKYACQQGFDMIVCSGGDGTLNEVIQGIMRSETKPLLGYIPSGSTNDFARGIGIPRTITEAVRCIIRGNTYSCDIGEFNNKYFTYIAAFGAFTEVSYGTSQQAKNYLGHAAYILNGLTKLSSIKSHHIKITADKMKIEDDFIFGMVTNSSSVAGLLSLNGSLFDDGLFEVTLIKTPSNVVDLQRIIHSLLNIGKSIDTDYVKSFRASDIRFECKEKLRWTIDGEFGGSLKKTRIKNNRRAVDIITNMKNNIL